MIKTHQIAVVLAGLLMFYVARGAWADGAAAPDPATVLAGRLEASFRTGDLAVAESVFDYDGFGEKATGGIQVEGSSTKDFVDNFRKSFIPSLIRSCADGGSFHFLRVHQVNGETRALYRMLGKHGGATYLDWIYETDDKGQPKFIDVYSASTGEKMSQTSRRMCTEAAIRQNLADSSKLSDVEKNTMDDLSKVDQLGSDYQAGKFKEALDDYKSLSPEMQQDKMVMVMRVGVTARLRRQSPQEYTSAMADFQRLFPGDPAVDLMCLDQLLTEKKFPQIHESLNRLDAYTGGDAYLKFLRGSAYIAEGGDDNLALAKKAYQSAIDMEPTLKNPYWGMVTLTLRTGDFDETAVWLDELRQKFGTKFRNLTKIPLYADFVKSDAYKKWIASQTAVPATQPN